MFLIDVVHELSRHNLHIRVDWWLVLRLQHQWLSKFFIMCALQHNNAYMSRLSKMTLQIEIMSLHRHGVMHRARRGRH